MAKEKYKLRVGDKIICIKAPPGGCYKCDVGAKATVAKVDYRYGGTLYTKEDICTSKYPLGACYDPNNPIIPAPTTSAELNFIKSYFFINCINPLTSVLSARITSSNFMVLVAPAFSAYSLTLSASKNTSLLNGCVILTPLIPQLLNCVKTNIKFSDFVRSNRW